MGKTIIKQTESELEDNPSDVGSLLYILRSLTSLSQRELAELSGTSYSQISEIENSIREPRLETLKKICQSLDIPFHVFLGIWSDFIMTGNGKNSDLTFITKIMKNYNISLEKQKERIKEEQKKLQLT